MRNREFEMSRNEIHALKKEKINKIREKWASMTDAEKLEFANHKFGKKEKFSVEKLDEFTSKWSQMTQEEKQVYVDERKNKMKEWRRRFGRRHCGHHSFSEHKHDREKSVVIQIIS